MDASILIPTHARPGKLRACLTALAQQTVPSDRFEVVVGIDGGDNAEPAESAWIEAGGHPASLRVVGFEKSGQTYIRHSLTPTLDGRIFISINDDVVPCADFVEQHLAAHAGREAVIIGHSPYVPHDDPSLLDALVDETALIFFYNTMSDTDPDHDWGYRHCYGLNFSAPLRAVLDVGGFHDLPATHFYEDLELGYRLSQAGLPLLYRPAAIAPHDHRQRPVDLMQREFLLGIAAVRYAKINTAFTRDLFGRDILAPEEAEYAREFIRRERADAERIELAVNGLADIPASTVTGPGRAATLRLIAQQFTLLKRFIWRQGLLAEIEGRSTAYEPLACLDEKTAA